MDNKLTEMLLRKPHGPAQLDMAVKEVLQESVLAALSSTDFFSKAAFYGGTALRIFFGLERFSEDLDFSLLRPDTSFSWAPYFPVIEKQFLRYGVKIILMDEGSSARLSLIEADAFPPAEGKAEVKLSATPMKPGAAYRFSYLHDPYLSAIRHFDASSLFAEAAISLLASKRPKGVAYYDYLFHVGRNTAINLAYLSSNLRKANLIGGDISIDGLRALLQDRFSKVDWKAASHEASSFHIDPSQADCWDESLFQATLPRLKAAS